jgi:hypothetical protein
MVPNCTLVTSCFVLTKYNPHARSREETLKNIETLLYIPVFLVIYCDSSLINDIKQIRNKKGYNHLTKYIEMDFENIWTYQYVKKVEENRTKYYPTYDKRTCPESHLLCSNKFDFLLKTIHENPFHTDKFGWIDSFLSREGNNIKICELLLSYKSNVNSQDIYGNSVLNHAILNKSKQCVIVVCFLFYYY